MKRYDVRCPRVSRMESLLPLPIRMSLMVTAVLLLTAACLGSVPRVNSDMLLVSIDSLERNDDVIVIDLAMRYLPERPLHYEEMVLELNLDGEPLARTRQPRPFDLPSRSRELVRVETDAEPAGLERLRQLGAGERPPMRWHLELTLVDERGRESPVEYNGWLHAVPGQPNRFR
jgi:LEA14-like dessication related protein